MTLKRPFALFVLLTLVEMVVIVYFATLFATGEIDYATFFGVIFIFMVIMFITIFFLFKGKIEAHLEYDGLSVRGPMVSVKVSYGDIISTETRDGVTYGIRLAGFQTLNKVMGTFRNSEFGTYKIAVNNSVKKFIVVRYSEKVLVFNLSTFEETERFYNELRNMVKR